MPRLGYPWRECPWQVWHKPSGAQWHKAFRLRALMVGDFAPGRTVRGHFVIMRDTNRPPTPLRAPVVCDTCGAVPETRDLDVEERATGLRYVLRAFREENRRNRARRWPNGTVEERCWWCQNPRVPVNGAGLCWQCDRGDNTLALKPQGPADVPSLTGDDPGVQPTEPPPSAGAP